MNLIKTTTEYIKGDNGVKSVPSGAEKAQLDAVLTDNQEAIVDFAEFIRTTIKSKSGVTEIAYKNTAGKYARYTV